MDVLQGFKARFTDIVPVGVVTEGRLAGARVRGIDYLPFRPDGAGVLDVRQGVEPRRAPRGSPRAWPHASRRRAGVTAP